MPRYQTKRHERLVKAENQQLCDSYAENLGNGITLEMIAIPGGTFIMGSPENEERSSSEERPQHEVTVPPFLMGKYPVTQAQWEEIASRTELKVERDLEPNPSYFKRDNNPVERVNWYDAVEFCARLSKLSGREYRLPSEAEWEYACRAGTTTPFYFGETITGELANYDASDEPKRQYRGETTPVGQFSSNAFGLYDMHGNVWEWCLDNWHDDYVGAPNDGSAWLGDNCESRVQRGGAWYISQAYCRSAYRDLTLPDGSSSADGFRVVLVSDKYFEILNQFMDAQKVKEK